MYFNLDLSDNFLVIKLRLCLLGKNTAEGTVPSVYHIRSTCYQYVPSLVTLTSISWFKVVSVQFLQCKVAVFPFVIKKYLEGDYTNTQFFIMFLPTKFTICCWFLPEAVITVVSDKWWWSNSIIPSLLLVGILLEEELFLIPHLFTYSCKIFISVWTLGCFFLLYE